MNDAADLPAGFAARVRSARSARWSTPSRSRSGDTIVVTNEVGLGRRARVRDRARLPRRARARQRARLSAVRDAAYLAVAGRLLDLSALPRDIAWPED